MLTNGAALCLALTGIFIFGSIVIVPSALILLSYHQHC